MATTTIQVSREVCDHLAELARERGLSLGQLAADREVVRRQIGIDLSDEEFDQAPDVLGNIYKIAAEKARTPRDTAA
jgi:4-aminobutyrate aminotransferase-like enzyme